MRHPNTPARVYIKKSSPKLPKVKDLVDIDNSPSNQTETDEEELKE